MGVPAPTTNLVVPPPKAPAQTATGIVNEVATGIDGVRRAYVNVNGSTFTCVVPGSVLGVMADKTVQISIQGNSRTVLAVTTPLDPPNYTGTPDSIERGPTDAPPTISNPTTSGTFYTAISTFSVASTDPNTITDFGRVNDRYANANANWALAVAGINGAIDDLQTLRDQVADLTATVEQMRNKQDTQVQDLQDGTGIFK